MCCYKNLIAGRTIKTAAALTAVVFLFCMAGCCNNTANENLREDVSSKKVRKKPVRKRASDYSRIPGNYPAGWQTMSVGN